MQEKNNSKFAIKKPYSYSNANSIKSIKWVLLVSLIIFPLIIWGSNNFASQKYLDILEKSSFHALKLHAANLRGELEKFQTIPKLLNTNLFITSALRFKNTKTIITEANNFLERINNITGASDTYIMDINGVTIASSNWDRDISFVGKNFNFRPYFINAAQGRLGRYFALGTSTMVRGYYFSSPVFYKGKIIGVSVIKINMDEIEAKWKVPSWQSLALSDDNDILFLTTRPEWRYRSLSILSKKMIDEISKSRKYVTMALEPTNLVILNQLSKNTKIIEIDILHNKKTHNIFRSQKYLMLSLNMPEAGWTLHLFSNYDIISKQVLIALSLISLVFASFIFIIIIFIQRIASKSQRVMFEEKARDVLKESAIELENKVTERTLDLRNANFELKQQIKVRRMAEKNLKISQKSLLQAEKLAALGKISAGISHELNQPLSAIRSYADNSYKFLERKNIDKAQENLISISELTQRMGNIIGQMKMFARNNIYETNSINLKEIINSALTVVMPRIENMAVDFKMDISDDEIHVFGSKDRLQQVFINLFTNSLDAMEDNTDADNSIYINIAPLDKIVEISVIDTGHGVDEDDISHIFDPFFSTKEIGKGLGLGLSISYSIIQDCGGKLQVYNNDNGGAEFIITLRLDNKDI